MRRLLVLLLGWAFTSASFAVSYEDIVRTVDQHRPRDVGELLSFLPPSYLAHYALMYESRSLQDASKESPRAIVFGEDARLLMAFNGDPKQAGYANLEMIQFREETREFEFRVLSFVDGKASFSEKNPQRCTACHGTRLRPNWQEYSEWPGAFGSKDDFLNEEETAAFAAFRKTASAHPRYRYLQPGYGPDWQEHHPIIRLFAPNTGLAVMLARHQAKHLASILARGERRQEAAWVYEQLCVDKPQPVPSGLSPMECTLSFDKPRYFSEMFWDGTFGLNVLLLNHVYADLEKSWPELKPFRKQKMLNYFNQNSSALNAEEKRLFELEESLGSAMAPEPAKAACEILRQRIAAP